MDLENNPFIGPEVKGAEVDEAMVAMHLAGHDARAIARKLNRPVAVVRAALSAVIDDDVPVSRAGRVALENHRIDALLTTFMPDALRGDIEAAKLVAILGRDRRKLLGLDAPVAVTVDAALSVVGVEDVVRRILDTAMPTTDIDGDAVEDFPVLDVSPALSLVEPLPDTAAED